MAFRALSDRDFDRYNFQLSEPIPSQRELIQEHERSQEIMAQATDIAITGATALGFGWYLGRYGSMPTILGMSLDLLVGIGLFAVNALGYGGSASEYLHSIANGAIASYAVNKGVEMGIKARVAAGTAASGAGTGTGTGTGVGGGWDYRGESRQAA